MFSSKSNHPAYMPLAEGGYFFLLAKRAIIATTAIAAVARNKKDCKH
ncbi:hypothetical protein ACMGD3_11290 [Lysinibacillus sphaericus]